MKKYVGVRIFAWLSLAIIAFATLSPIELRPRDLFPVNIDRALAFAILALLFSLAYPRNPLVCVAFVIVIAFMLELSQGLQPSRHALWRDAVVKSAGASIGFFVAWAGLRAKAMIMKQ